MKNKNTPVAQVTSTVTANNSLARVQLKVFSGLVAALLSASAFAGNFGVSPLDLQLNTATKSGVLTVTNDDSKPLSLRVRAMRWTQDSSGKDLYEDATELIFFPKRFDLKPGEQRVVRAGIDQFSRDTEVAYRLFIEDIPPADLPREGGSRLAVLLSIGIPIFAMPGPPKPAAVVLDPSLDKSGTLKFAVKNAGNTRLRIARVLSKDGKTVLDGVESRYVFPGVTKAFTGRTSSDACTSLGALVVESDTIKISASESVRCQ